MRTSWADSVANAGGSVSANNVAGSASRPALSTYVPPHLRNRPPTSDAPVAAKADAPSGISRPSGYRGPPGAARWGGGGCNRDMGRPGVGSGRFTGSRWNNQTGGWDRGREREVNLFAIDDGTTEASFGEQGNTGINFDAYEDIPVETSGGNVPPPVNTFAEIDLGHVPNENIRRCKYVKPTPVQRHAIPISLAGRHLVACAQTGSGKTTAFCFPIIGGIMRGKFGQREATGWTDTISSCSYFVSYSGAFSPNKSMLFNVCEKLHICPCLVLVQVFFSAFCSLFSFSFCLMM